MDDVKADNKTDGHEPHPNLNLGSVMATLTDEEMKKGMLIGVCGVQGSGKTVFQAAVYNTLAGGLSEKGVTTLDNKHYGGANHFKVIEREILRTGKSTATEGGVLARVFIPRSEFGEADHSKMPIYLFDFAGRYFENISDIKAMTQDEDLPPQEKENLLKVNKYLEHCDGLILIISSTDFSLDDVAKVNPFDTSVTFLLNHCFDNKVPVALVFSKADLNPSLTEEKINEFEYVARFKQQFTDDLTEVHNWSKTYGTVRSLKCYELIRGEAAPRKQDSTGNIWCQEPRQVFLDLLHAAWPRAEERIGEQHKKNWIQLKKIAEEEKQRRRWRWLSAAALLTLFLIGALGTTSWLHQKELADFEANIATLENMASDLKAGQMEQIQLSILKNEIITKPWPYPQDKDLEVALKNLASAFTYQAKSVVSEAQVTPHYAALVNDLFRLGTLADYSDWEEDQALLKQRALFLTSWHAKADVALEERQQLLDQWEMSFINDRSFEEQIRGLRTQLNEERVKDAASSLKLKLSLPDTLTEIKRLLIESTSNDKEYQLLLRTYLASYCGEVLLLFSENKMAFDAFKKLVPEISEADNVVNGLRLAQIYRYIGRIQSLAGYEKLRQEATSVFGELRDRNNDFLIEDTLSRLFDAAETTPAQRSELWLAFLDSMKSKYLFTTNASDDINGVNPLPDYFSIPPEMSLYSSQVFIKKLAENPVYFREFEAVVMLIDKRILRLRTMAYYRSLHDSLTRGFSGRVGVDAIESLISQAEIILAGIIRQGGNHLKESEAYIREHIEQLHSIQRTINSYNREKENSYRSDPDVLIRSLWNLLMAHCDALNLSEGVCDGVH